MIPLAVGPVALTVRDLDRAVDFYTSALGFQVHRAAGDTAALGAGGADLFVYGKLPWNAGRITDFTPGEDVLDLRPLFQAAGYAGTDPIADHHLEFRPDGAGGTQVYVDRDAPGSGDWPFLITTLDGVAPSAIGPGDWLFR